MVFESPTPADTTVGFTGISTLPGLTSLWAKTKGDSRVCVAVLDGPVYQSHSCFEGANLTRLQTLVSDGAGNGLMSGHGTHITSVIFGQHSSPVRGIAPGCRGLIVPVFSDNHRGSLSQLDLARAINQAVEAGAHVINISGGQLAQTAEADPMLANAVRFCNDNGVLIVAAAGNDGCQCLHVPAALPSVLAVGAMNAQGLPFDFSNWGEAYQTQGILAPGENILGAVPGGLGAVPGGGTALKSGTSFATPIVSGIVALLLSIQLQRGEKPDPHAVRDAILKSALPCNPEAGSECRRFLVGSLSIPGADALITQGGRNQVSDEQLEVAMIQPSEASNLSLEASANPSPDVGVQAVEATTSELTSTTVQNLENAMTVTPSPIVASSVTPSSVVASGDCGCNSGSKSLVYALGTLSYDLGTEARRDSFKQYMDQLPDNPPPNPYVVSQMVQHLRANSHDAQSLIWTLNIELTPVYAIEPAGPFAQKAYENLISAIEGQIQPEDSAQFVSRVSIPGLLTGRSVRLFSGQVVPVIVPEVRGMNMWNVNQLVNAAVNAVGAATGTGQVAQQQQATRTSLKEFLNRVYYEFRNLGQTSQERALNAAATNAFQVAEALNEATSKGMQLDSITAEKSPFCRMDSDCWDVKLKFFDPENDQRSKKVFRFTLDVSDVTPVTVGEIRSWSVSD